MSEPEAPHKDDTNLARKAKTGKGKRHLKGRESLVVENPKCTMLLRGQQTSEQVNQLLKDLHTIKAPLTCPMLRRRQPKYPHEDPAWFEYLSKKNDCSLMVFGSSTKKRPFRLVVQRFFEYARLDAAELHVDQYLPMSSFDMSPAVKLGSKPLVLFQGPNFDHTIPLAEEWGTLRSLLLDLSKGPDPTKLLLTGVDRAVVYSELPPREGSNGRPIVKMSHYHVKLLKSGNKIPKVEMQEIGPRIEFWVDKIHCASPDTLKLALKIPSEVKLKKQKNVTTNELGQKRGRIFMEKQDLRNLHTPHHHGGDGEGGGGEGGEGDAKRRRTTKRGGKLPSGEDSD